MVTQSGERYDAVEFIQPFCTKRNISIPVAGRGGKNWFQARHLPGMNLLISSRCSARHHIVRAILAINNDPENCQDQQLGISFYIIKRLSEKPAQVLLYVHSGDLAFARHKIL